MRLHVLQNICGQKACQKPNDLVGIAPFMDFIDFSK